MVFRFFKYAFLLSIILLLHIRIVDAQFADSPWPMLHGTAQHGGQSPYNTEHIDGTLKWVFEANGEIESSPVIDKNGIIYFGAHDGKLYAINSDGTLKWTFNAGPPVYDERWNVSKSIMATPAIASDGTIYIHSSANYLFAVNPDGTEKWRFSVKWHNDFWSSPTVDGDGTIYIGSARAENDPEYKGGFFAINPDGTEKWFFEDDSGITSTAAISLDGTIYVGGNDKHPEGGNIGNLLALDPNGKLIWKFSIENWMESSPTIGKDGTIYVGTGMEARFYALNPDGTVKWQFQVGTGTSTIPAIGKDGTIFAGAWDTYMYALNPDGTKKWSFKTPDAFEGVISSVAIGAEGTIYFGSNAGIFYALNPNGSEKWHYDTKSSIPGSPAIGSDGTVYVGAWDKKLYAFGASTETEQFTVAECKDVELSKEIKLVTEPIKSCLDASCTSYSDACIRWNFFGTTCYEYKQICESATCTRYKVYCNLIVRNIEESVGGTFSFNANYITNDQVKHLVSNISYYLQDGSGNSFSWSYDVDADKLGSCNYSDFKTPTKTICENEIADLENKSEVNAFGGSTPTEPAAEQSAKDVSFIYIVGAVAIVVIVGIVIVLKKFQKI